MALGEPRNHHGQIAGHPPATVHRAWLRPTSIVGTYVALAAAWIIVSDLVLELALGDDHTLYSRFQAFKGLGFVAVTAGVLYLLIRRFAADLDRVNAHARRMARFADLSPHPIIEFAPDGSVALANAAARETADGLAVSMEQLLPSDASAIAMRCIRDGRDPGALLHATAGRNWRWYFFPVDAPSGAYAYGYDRTQEARLELQLEQAARMESVGRLSAGVAHDLGNILTAISGHHALLAMQLPPGDPTHEDLEGIRAQIDRARDLVQKLLMVARVRPPEERPERVDLAVHLPAIASTVRHLLPWHIQFVVDLPPGPIHVSVSLREFEQALLNLAANAVDAMTSDGVLRVTVDPAGDDGQIGILVQDTGSGIPPEVLPRIFDPFFTTKQEGKGTGLGLASVYAFATRSGGTVRVESHPGEGTCFILLLPRAA